MSFDDPIEVDDLANLVEAAGETAAEEQAAADAAAADAAAADGDDGDDTLALALRPRRHAAGAQTPSETPTQTPRGSDEDVDARHAARRRRRPAARCGRGARPVGGHDAVAPILPRRLAERLLPRRRLVPFGCYRPRVGGGADASGGSTLLGSTLSSGGGGGVGSLLSRLARARVLEGTVELSDGRVVRASGRARARSASARAARCTWCSCRARRSSRRARRRSSWRRSSCCRETRRVPRGWRRISVMRKLRHPHIVRYCGVARHAAKTYILMEYVAGGSLKELVERNHPRGLPPPLLWRYGVQRRPLPARGDDHPPRPEGRQRPPRHKCRRRIADFGSSELAGSSTLSNNVHSLRGSPYWMSPEQSRGRAAGGRRTSGRWGASSSRDGDGDAAVARRRRAARPVRRLPDPQQDRLEPRPAAAPRHAGAAAARAAARLLRARRFQAAVVRRASQPRVAGWELASPCAHTAE